MAEPRYRYGGDSAIGALLLPERREILRDEQNQFIGYDDRGQAIVQTLPAQYGESEVDFSYSPIVRGAKATGSFLNDIFFGDANEQAEAAGRAVSAVRGVVGGLGDYASSQYEAGMAGGTTYDPETRQITEFDPTAVMVSGAPAGIQAARNTPSNQVIFGTMGSKTANYTPDQRRVMDELERQGMDTENLFLHGTSDDIRQPTSSRTGSRDSGFIGKGFYGATPEGSRISDSYAYTAAPRFRNEAGDYSEPNVFPYITRRGNYKQYSLADKQALSKQARQDEFFGQDLAQKNIDEGFIGAEVVDADGSIIERVNYFPDTDTRSALNYDTTDLYSGGGRQGSAIAGGSALHNLKMRAVNGDESAIAELMTIEGLDRDNVVRRLQNYVARYEGQSPEQRAIEYNASKPVRLGQSTEERMQRSSEQGYSGPYYTGAARLDRLLQENEILPERATSGPMPFFTTDPELASSYAKNKRDTSLELNDNKEAFTVNPVDLNLPRDREITVEDSWNYLDPDKKAEILNKVERIGYEDLDNFEGKFVLHPEGVKGLPSSKDHFDYIMRTEAKGNPLAALRELWLDSGNLYDKEELMEVIYKLSGFPARISQINAPWTEASGVLPVMMRLKNPVDTTNTDSLKQTVIPALREAFSDPKYNVKSETLGADQWDKNTRFTPKEWVEQLAEDISNGENSYVWTSIPDEVTLQLEKLGYDSIIDVSGKSGGDIKEKVIIPFKPNQVRSINAEFDPEKIDSADLLSNRQSERQMSALRGIA